MPLLSPYRAEYQLLEDDGDLVGHAIRSFTRSPQSNLWTLRIESKAQKLFFTDKRLEESIFKLKDGYPQPIEYRYLVRNTFSTKTTIERFDWQKGIAIGKRSDNRHWQKPIKLGVVDPLSVQWALRRQLSAAQSNLVGTSFNFLVSKKSDIREEHFDIIGYEPCTTPLGTDNCVITARHSGSRLTHTWHAQKLCYLPVQIQQYKKDKLQATARLHTIRTMGTSGTR